jgi:hypothetical protein
MKYEKGSCLLSPAPPLEGRTDHTHGRSLLYLDVDLGVPHEPVGAASQPAVAYRESRDL